MDHLFGRAAPFALGVEEELPGGMACVVEWLAAESAEPLEVT
jgi:hypothetical protein